MNKKILYFLSFFITVALTCFFKRQSIKTAIQKYTEKTEYTKLFMKMKKNMQKRFLSVDNVPIILAVDFKIQLNFGNDIVIETVEECTYFLNEQSAIVSCSIESCEEVVKSLSKIFSKAFHCVCFSIYDSSNTQAKKIESVFYNLQSVSNMNTSIILCYYAEFKGSIDKYGPFGFSFDKYSKTHIPDGIDKTQEDISYAFLCDQRIFNVTPSGLFNLVSMRENIEVTCNIFSENLNGVFFYDSRELLEIVFQRIAYSYCSYAKSTGILHSIVKNILFIIRMIGYLIAIFLTLRYCFFIFKNNKEITKSVQNVKKVKQAIRSEDVSYFLKSSSISYSPIIQVIASDDISKIRTFQDNLLGILVEEAKKRDKQAAKDFFAQPCDTDSFFDLNQNINDVCRMYKIVKQFDHADVYKQVFSEKIIFLFEEFFKNFENYKLFSLMNKLSVTLEKILNQNTDIYENTCELRDIMIEIKRVQQSFLNKWIFDFHDEKYIILLANVKKAFGIQLIEHIDRLKKQYLDLLFSKIENCDFIGLEKVFEIKSNQIYLTAQFNSVLNTIIYVLQNNQQEEMRKMPQKEKFVFWDLEKINQSLSIFKENQQVNTNKNPLLEKIASLTSFENIKRKLLNAQQNRECFTLIEMAVNTSQALEKIKLLFQDLQKDQQRDFFSELLEIFKSNFNNISGDFINEITNSLTVYTKLEKWKEKEDLVFFLFNVQKEELNYTVEKMISHLVDLNNNVLSPLMKNADLFKNRTLMEYFYKQISNYEKGELNSLSPVEALMKSLKDWQIKWRTAEEQTASPREFIKYHYENFKNILIAQTNKILFEESKLIFNNLVKIFNQKLSGKFPFGTESRISLADLVYFSNLYQNQKDRLQQDKSLLSISFVKDTIDKFNEMMDFFTLEASNLSHGVYVQSYYKKDENCQYQNDNLIMKYTYSFANQRYEKDNVETKISVKDNFSLNIKIANSSVFKISPIDSHNVLKSFEDSNLTIITDGYSIDFNFSNYFTFFRFVHKFFFLAKKEYLMLKIVIPIENKKDPNHKSEIVTYIRIDNFPSFPSVLFEIE